MSYLYLLLLLLHTSVTKLLFFRFFFSSSSSLLQLLLLLLLLLHLSSIFFRLLHLLIFCKNKQANSLVLETQQSKHAHTFFARTKYVSIFKGNIQNAVKPERWIVNTIQCKLCLRLFVTNTDTDTDEVDSLFVVVFVLNQYSEIRI